MKHYQIRPCVNHLGNQTGWDICHPVEPGATGAAVVATVFESEGVARVMAAALDAVWVAIDDEFAALAAGAGTAETSGTSARAVGRQSGAESATPTPDGQSPIPLEGE